MTLSVLGRDPASGAVGVAVASRALAVGSRVPHFRRQVGAVVVQAFAPLEWGPLALDLLSQGATASGVIGHLQTLPGADAAQVAILQPDGLQCGFTGPSTEPHAGITRGNDCCAAANLMERPGVTEAVVSSFEASSASTLAERLCDALAVGDSLGGDIRGRQSASLRVVLPDGQPGTGVDLRVDDSRAPVVELARLLTLHRAHELTAGSVDSRGHYREVQPLLHALQLAPDDLGCLSALSLALVRAGRLDEAAPHLARLAELEPRTQQRLHRLITTGHLDEELGQQALQRLTCSQGASGGG
jgi:uncharacterized Ntn-hydrolase superfamily protein